VHTPAWHASVCVQAFPSLQGVPFVATGFEQAPLAGSHVPATWHWSAAVHVTRFEPVQAPALHVSVCVHAFPSLHVVPSVTFEYCVVLTLGWHVWHAFVPLLAPGGTHAPPIVQPEHPPMDPRPS
jgi:hypothetical protein